MTALVVLAVFILFVYFIIGLANKEEKTEYDKDDINYYIDNYNVYTDDYLKDLDDDATHIDIVEANAKLNAAAPEMIDILSTIENDNGEIPDWLWKRIKDVIKKATE